MLDDQTELKGLKIPEDYYQGVKIITFIETTDKDTGQTKKRPWTTTVFHVSQTKPLGE